MCCSKIPVTSLHAQRPHSNRTRQRCQRQLRRQLRQRCLSIQSKRREMKRKQCSLALGRDEMRQNEIGEIHDMLMMTSMTRTHKQRDTHTYRVTVTHTETRIHTARHARGTPARLLSALSSHTHTYALISPTLPKIATRRSSSRRTTNGQQGRGSRGV